MSEAKLPFDQYDDFVKDMVERICTAKEKRETLVFFGMGGFTHDEADSVSFEMNVVSTKDLESSYEKTRSYMPAYNQFMARSLKSSENYRYMFICKIVDSTHEGLKEYEEELAKEAKSSKNAGSTAKKTWSAAGLGKRQYIRFLAIDKETPGLYWQTIIPITLTDMGEKEMVCFYLDEMKTMRTKEGGL